MLSLAIPLLSGCTLLEGNSSVKGELNSWKSVEPVVRNLRLGFENQDEREILDTTHMDYERYRSDLGRSLEDVFRTYDNIDLTFHGARANRTNGRIEADLRWDLRWVCQRPTSQAGSTCDDSSASGDTIKRVGRTVLVFEQKGEDWLLVNQKQDRLFGSLQPGRTS